MTRWPLRLACAASLSVATALLPTTLTAIVNPTVLTVTTARGETSIPIRAHLRGGPGVSAPMLLAALGGTHRIDGGWAEVVVARQGFRFLLNASWMSVGNTPRPLAGRARLVRDTLYLPLQFAAEILPRTLGAVFRYDVATAQLTEIPGRAVAAATPPTAARSGAGEPALSTRTPATRDADRLPNGLRRGHVVAVDPGHGGVDPGNRGIALPRGTSEKDINLAVSLLLRDELQRQGIAVRMTRTTDTLINLFHRAPRSCRDDCDLFVSIHVNSLDPRPGYTNARGFETFVLSEARTEDARRVAQMENEALRFERPEDLPEVTGLDFILKDLQMNEHLRESVRAAELVQSHMREVHSGPNRGVKHGLLAVLTTARRPAILVELGFATNQADARLMTTAQGQRDLANSIASAIVAYLREYEQRAGIAVPQGEGGRE
ncbi:MAG TPA: N-acetylmuramoyl-L-alanine amidase [Gemmatimonadales bacterium]|nr:N-acetylmuramoyl-L-alanine amidase [Gemmatimonadales bacterium]